MSMLFPLCTLLTSPPSHQPKMPLFFALYSVVAAATLLVQKHGQPKPMPRRQAKVKCSNLLPFFPPLPL